MLSNKNNKNDRVPSNIHPNHIADSSSSSHPIVIPRISVEEDEEEELFYSAHATPISIKNSIQNFAGSYSRASILYLADEIGTSGSHAASIVENNDEEQLLYKPETRESASLYHTFSQRTTDYYGNFEPLSKHTTVASIISKQLSTIPQDVDDQDIKESFTPQKSSFVQSIFNSVNVLVGVGILALPISFRLAGWLYGSIIFIFCCLVTNYTAKLIVKCLSYNNQHGSTYGDMGQIAFGEKGRNLISTVFVIELVTIGVAMIVLLGDGIQSLFPALNTLNTRIISFFILTPTVFLPIKKLAYTSLIGIIACISLVIIVLYDGLSKTVKPGSLIDPMETELIPRDISNLPLTFGLIMSVFAGHAVFPSIYHDMERPEKYNRMVDITYGITVIIYILMAIIGYLMFGQDALQEITQNLALIPEYSQALNRFAIWLLVFTPLAKYGLMMQPLNLSWELVLLKQSHIETWLFNHIWRKRFVLVTGKILVTAILVYIALVFPGFDKVMSLLGALFSFTISIIFPLICHLQLFKAKLSPCEIVLNWLLLFVAIVMAALGTIWSLIPTTDL